jgi:hypothetical protein
MKTIHTFTNGARRVEVGGITLTVDRTGRISWASDWGDINKLVESGLVRRVHYPHLWGHTEFILVEASK